MRALIEFTLRFEDKIRNEESKICQLLYSVLMLSANEIPRECIGQSNACRSLVCEER